MDKLLVRAAIYHEVTYLAGGILAFDNLYFQMVLARRELFFKHVHPWDVKSLAPLRPGVQRLPGTLVRTVPERTGVGACDAEDADSRCAPPCAKYAPSPWVYPFFSSGRQNRRRGSLPPPRRSPRRIWDICSLIFLRKFSGLLL